MVHRSINNESIVPWQQNNWIQHSAVYVVFMQHSTNTTHEHHTTRPRLMCALNHRHLQYTTDEQHHGLSQPCTPSASRTSCTISVADKLYHHVLSLPCVDAPLIQA
mmetsp:Transcript_28690/g.73967  ORF Transcript_28690/g.73967 Transcript_28690/m.73967 type:complete len:106 (-) Transcript_28690:2900-3217(-)